MLIILGLTSFFAVLFLEAQKVPLVEPSVVFPKTLFDFLGNLFSMSISLTETLKILGLLPFSGRFRFMRRRFLSMSIHSKLKASPALMAVSFNVCRKVAVFFPQLAINWSISASVGMKGKGTKGNCYSRSYWVRKGYSN